MSNVPQEEGQTSEANENENRHRDELTGGALLRLILEKAERENLDRYALADRLGITYSYLTLILRGERDVPSISQDRLRRFGEFLEIPFIQVLMLAEIISSEDFLEGDEKTIEQEFDRVWTSLNNDPLWRGTAPNRKVWKETPRESKILIGLLYNQIAQENILRLAKRIKVVSEDVVLDTTVGKGKKK